MTGIRVYLEFLNDDAEVDREQEMSGGGLVHSMSGWSTVNSMRKQGLKEASDVQVLGSGEIVFTGPLDRMTRDALNYIPRNYLKETVIKHHDRAEAE